MKLDETNKEYGDLVVGGPAASRHGKAYWRCDCECGRMIIVKGSDLRAGRVTDCGHHGKPEPEPQPPFTLAQALKEITDLKERVTSLESGAPLVVKPKPAPEPAPEPAPAPAPQAQPDLDKAIARIQELAAIPFHERGERLAELREEMRLNIEIVVNDLRKVSDYNPRFKGDPVGEARNDQLVGFMLAHKKYHLNPDA